MMIECLSNIVIFDEDFNEEEWAMKITWARIFQKEEILCESDLERKQA